MNGVQEGAFDKESGPQNAGPALPSTSCVDLEKSLHLPGFYLGTGHKILRKLPLLIAEDPKITYFGFFNIILSEKESSNQTMNFTLPSGRK